MAPLPVAAIFEESLGRVPDRRLVPVFAALYVLQLAAAVGTQSQLSIQREELGDEPFAASPFVSEELLPETFPLAVDVPIGVAMLLWVTALVLTVTVTMVALRILVTGTEPTPSSGDDSTVAEDGVRAADEAVSGASRSDSGVSRSDSGVPGVDSEGFDDGSEILDDGSEDSAVDPGSIDTADLGSATLHGILAGLVLGIAVFAGLVAFVIPGLIVATLFAVTYPVIAVERVSFVEALQRSFALTRGNRVRVFVIVLVVVAAHLLVSSAGAVAAVALEPLSPLGDLLNVGAGAFAWLVVLAILASAYDRLAAIRTAHEAKWEGIDDELLP